ncbi:MAG: hypothetical protein KAJ23_02365, partial [Maribacter sp.]|nr:hypothetical protein [Maribacter sp.]
ERRRQNLFIVGTDASANGPLYDCDKVYLTPISELPPSNYADAISKIILDESPDLIIPGRDIDVIILAMLKTRFPLIADRFITGEPHLAILMEDKWLSYLFAKNEDLPFAETILLDLKNNKKNIDLFIQKHGFPLILKPRKGFASKAVSFILNYDQLHNVPSDGEVILQEYLGNPDKILDLNNNIINKGLPLFYSLEEVKYSMQCYIGKSGQLKGSLVTVHKMKNGVSAEVEILENHGLNDLIDKYSDAFSKNGWFGPLNIQLQKSNETGELKAYEFNGRYTGATAARYVLGFDEVGYALEQISSHVEKDNLYNSQKNVLKQTYFSKRPDKHISTLNKHKQWNA